LASVYETLFSCPFSGGALDENTNPIGIVKSPSLYGSAFSFLFGGTTRGKAVNQRTAMQTTAVYACVRILAQTIASLPLHIYGYTAGGKKKAVSHQLYCLLHDEPNPEMKVQ